MDIMRNAVKNRAGVSLFRLIQWAGWATALSVCSLGASQAQPEQFLTQRDEVACAPTLTESEPTSPLRLIGTTDVVTRLVYGSGQTVVVGHAAGQGLETGQMYFVRRIPRRFGGPRPEPDRPVGVHTAGWIRILEVSGDTATAEIVRACDGLLPGDYLEPFSPLRVPRRANGTPREDDLATVLAGDEERGSAAVLDALIVDRGAKHGVVPGDTFVVLREKRGEASPPAEVGEGIVLAVQATTATVQVTRSRDAVLSGDRIAFRR
jgi:hypothetical protein